MTNPQSQVPSPSASGARLTGDDLQHLIGWYWALKAMRPEFEVATVTFESLNAGNLDDIVVYRTGGGARVLAGEGQHLLK